MNELLLFPELVIRILQVARVWQSLGHRRLAIGPFCRPGLGTAWPLSAAAPAWCGLQAVAYS